MATLANLTVAISGNTVGLNKSLQKAQTRVDKFRSRAGLALKAVRTAALGLAVAGGASLVAFGVKAVQSFVGTGDELDKMSKRLGISVETLSELKFAAEQSGASLDDIEKAVKKLSSSVFDANNGVKASADAFQALGLNAAMLQDLSPEEQFLAVTKALAQVENASTRAALAQDVFGRAGTTLLPLVAEGAEGLEELRQRARDLGITFTTGAAAKAADFTDALNELKVSIGGLGNVVAEKIVPALTNLLNWFTDNREAVGEFLGEVQEKVGPFVEAFVSGAGFVLEALGKVLSWIVSNKPVLIALIIAIGIAIVTALGPVSLAVLAILGIITAIGFVRDNWDTIWNTILGVWDTVSGAILTAYESNFGWLLPAGPLVKAILFVRDNWDTIWNTILGVWDTVSGAISGIWDTAWGWLKTGFSTAVEAVKTVWDTQWDLIFSAFDTISGTISGIWDTAWGWLKTGFSTAVEAVKTVWDTIWKAIFATFDFLSSAIYGVWLTAWGWLKTGFGVAIGFVRDNWDTIWQAIFDTFDRLSSAIYGVWLTAWGWLKTGFSTAVEAVKTVWDTVWGGIRSGFSAFVSPINRIIDGLRSNLDSLLDALSRARSAISNLPNVPTSAPGLLRAVLGSAIPGYASGVQNFRGGMALVGERGPELVNLPRGSDVIPSGRGGSSMTTVVNMNFYGDIYGDDFDRRVNEARLRWERAGNA